MDILDEYFADIIPLIDVTRIEQGIIELGQIEQNTDFDSFARSADYLNRRFLSIEMESKILRFPADGKTKYQCWTAPIGFRTTRAVCSIVEPGSCARVLGDRDIEPNTAIVGTGHTGPEGVEAEVVHIKEHVDISRIDVKDKIVYCSDFGAPSIRQKVVEGQGRAIVSSFTKNREGNYNYVKWVNDWDFQTDGWLPTVEAQEENLPGISISPEMGDYLEGCLAKGPVKLKIVTEGEYFESELLGVTAVSAGQDGEQVLLTGHLFEQGLVDNASGVIIGFSVSEIIHALKDKLKIAKFQRGLRNFHSQECYGVLALSKYHPEIPEKAFAHLNMDMIGKEVFPLILRPGLLVSAGFSGFLLRLILERARLRGLVPTCKYELKNEFGINCTILAEPALGGVSTSSLEQNNPEWHTSHDRGGAQKLDHDMIRFTTLAAATWVYFLVAARDQEAEWLLTEYKKDVENTLSNEDVADAQIYLDTKQQEMASITTIVSPDKKASFLRGIRRFITDMRTRIKDENVIVPIGTEQEVEKSKRLSPKTILGGPAVEECFTEEQLQDIGSPKWSNVQLVLKSWADGNRSIYDITRLAIFETGVQLSLEYTLAVFQHYATQGIVSL